MHDPTGRKLITEQRVDVILIVGLCMVSASFPYVGFIISAIVAIAHGVDTLDVINNERDNLE